MARRRRREGHAATRGRARPALEQLRPAGFGPQGQAPTDRSDDLSIPLAAGATRRAQLRSAFAELHFHAAELGQYLHLAAARLGGVGMTCLGGFDGEHCASLARLEDGEETISIERLTSEADISPIIRLVDTTIFNALERRASDIHIETRDQEVAIRSGPRSISRRAPALGPLAAAS